VRLQYGADIHIGGGKAGSPLNEAILAGNRDVVGQLMKKGVDVDMLAGDYGSALQCASFKGYWPFVDSLLENRVDPNIHGGKYHTALQAAFQKPDSCSFNILLYGGADITVISRYGTTLKEALRHAIQDLSEVYVEQTSTKSSKGLWRTVKNSTEESFTVNFEICKTEPPKERDDPAFLCSLEPVDVEFED
jgi:ankyrin repeat protein